MGRQHLGSILSGDELNLDEVWDWYDFQATLIGEERIRAIDALRRGAALNQPRYFGRTREELVEFFYGQGHELKIATMLSLLAATEAALRIDYVVRVMQNKKDEVSKDFAALYKERKLKISLEEQILEVWKQRSTQSTAKAAIGEFNGALNLRHWLAHGRYWKPRLGQEYDPQDIFQICEALLKATVFQ